MVVDIFEFNLLIRYDWFCTLNFYMLKLNLNISFCFFCFDFGFFVLHKKKQNNFNIHCSLLFIIQCRLEC